jgi:hypothetical protein
MIKQSFVPSNEKIHLPKTIGSTHLGPEISAYIMIGNLPHYTSDNAQVVQILLIC